LSLLQDAFDSGRSITTLAITQSSVRGVYSALVKELEEDGRVEVGKTSGRPTLRQRCLCLAHERSAEGFYQLRRVLPTCRLVVHLRGTSARISSCFSERYSTPLFRFYGGVSVGTSSDCNALVHLAGQEEERQERLWSWAV